jgi:hypothetical protein
VINLQRERSAAWVALYRAAGGGWSSASTAKHRHQPRHTDTAKRHGTSTSPAPIIPVRHENSETSYKPVALALLAIFTAGVVGMTLFSPASHAASDAKPAAPSQP